MFDPIRVDIIKYLTFALAKRSDNSVMKAWVLKVVVCATLLTAPAWAQHGGGGSGGHGGGGGGAHGGFGGAHGVSGGGFGGHSGNGVRIYGSGYGWNGRGWNGGSWGWRGNGWRGNGWGWRGYPYRYYAGWRGYPWWGWGGYGYPGWGWYGGYYDSSYDSDDGYDSSYAQQYPTYAYLPPSGSTATYATQDEVQRIQQEVNQLRAAQAQRYSDQIHTETVLVYRDGHKETIQNYAVTGNTLWIFNENHARKVPLSSLDLNATRRDNDERGVDFIVPNASR